MMGHMPEIATNRTVDRSKMEDFVRPRHHGVLLTTRRDGRPQSSLVTMGLDTDGRIVVSTYPERAKVHNIRRDPAVSVVVLSDDFGGEWVQVDGAAQVIDLPGAVEPLVEYFRVISGEHPDWDEYREAMVRQGKCLIRVTIERWGPIAKGGFPARLVG
jgi:PPOX class probable F420-dependent enzyme